MVQLAEVQRMQKWCITNQLSEVCNCFHKVRKGAEKSNHITKHDCLKFSSQIQGLPYT